MKNETMKANNLILGAIYINALSGQPCRLVNIVSCGGAWLVSGLVVGVGGLGAGQLWGSVAWVRVSGGGRWLVCWSVVGVGGLGAGQ